MRSAVEISEVSPPSAVNKMPSPDWEKIQEEATSVLSEYLRIDTTNPPGGETAGARFLAGILEREGLEAKVLESRPGRGNVASTLKGQGGLGPLILLHHIDVVPAEPEKWKNPPYSGAVIDGEVWGRGAQDCKSLGVAELFALLLLKREGFRPRRNITYLATADEETGGEWGAGWMVQNHPELTRAEYLINEGGGTGLKIGHRNVYTCQTAEKGVCWIKIVFRGTPGHGSIPQKDNCVIKMARAVERISSHRSALRLTPTTRDFIRGIAEEMSFPQSFVVRQLTNPLLSRFAQERIPEPGLRGMAGAILRNTFVPTVVGGGTKTNVIPGECSCEVDCRMIPGVSPDMIKSEVQHILRGFSGYEIETLQTCPASESPADNDFYRALERVLREVDGRAKLIPTMMTGSTDSKFFREKGTVAYGFHPMIPHANIAEYVSQVHGHDERISSTNLVFGIQVLYRVLKEFCA